MLSIDSAIKVCKLVHQGLISVVNAFILVKENAELVLILILEKNLQIDSVKVWESEGNE